MMLPGHTFFLLISWEVFLKWMVSTRPWIHRMNSNHGQSFINLYKWVCTNLRKGALCQSEMSLEIHISLNQNQIKALCGKKFHQTCLPGSTPSNMLFIPPLCALCVLSSTCTHTGTLYTEDQTSLWLKTSRPLCQLWLSLCLLHCSTGLWCI